MPTRVQVFAGLLNTARQIAAAATEAEVAAALALLPAESVGGGRVEFVTSAPHDSRAETPPGTSSVPVLCRGRAAGEVRLIGAADPEVAGQVLPELAGVISAALDNIRALRDYRSLTDGLQLDRVYFEQLFEVSPEAIVVLDHEDRVVRANREFENLFGYTISEAQGRTINELIVPPDLQESAVSLTREVAAGRSVHAEALRRRKDGSTLHASILGTPIVVQGDQVAVYGIYRDISAQKETEEALRRLSTTDDLTGLFNRRGFFLLAEQQRRLAVRKRAELLLLYIDIDDFKLINDSHGHIEGDRVLADLSQILRTCFRDSDIVARMGDHPGLLARMGGDEFVILAIDAGDKGEEILTTRLRERIDMYNEQQQKPYTLSLSIGSVRVLPTPEISVDSLIATADALMYGEKRERTRP